MTTAVHDASLIAEAASGDVPAFAQLVDRYRAAVCSVALAIVRDVATSEDVAQEVFVAAWRRLSELRSPDSLGPWLRQIARNRANDVLRHRVRESPVDPQGPMSSVTDPADLHETALAAERDAVVEEALDELPTDAREILLLFYREGQSVRQVARLLDLSEVSVRKRLSRARRRLRDDVLSRFADAAQQSAPGAAFTASVVGALTVGSPSVASAAAGTTIAVAGKLTKVALGGAGVGAALGALGVVSGMRRHIAAARSVTERNALQRITKIAVAHVVLTAFALLPLVHFFPHPITVWAWYAVLIGGQALVHFRWVPRVIEQRLVAERDEDPEAAVRQRRQWRMGTAGWVLGALGGGVATAYAAAFAG